MDKRAVTAVLALVALAAAVAAPGLSARHSGPEAVKKVRDGDTPPPLPPSTWAPPAVADTPEPPAIPHVEPPAPVRAVPDVHPIHVRRTDPAGLIPEAAAPVPETFWPDAVECGRG